MRLVYADSALQDLDDISAYIAADSPRSAEQMEDLLTAACRGLTDFPFIGQAVEAAGARELTTVRPYVIVYRVLPEVIRIERIIHGARLR